MNAFRTAGCAAMLFALAASSEVNASAVACFRNHYILDYPCVPPNLQIPQVPAGVNHWTTIGPDGAHVVALAIDPVTPSTAFAGTLGSGVLKTTDAGASWATANLGLSPANVLALAIDPAKPSTVYAGTSAGVFKSTDGGESWVAANGGLGGAPQIVINALAIDPSSPAIMYAGTSGGVFKTLNGAASWALLGNGPPGDPVFITIDPTAPSTLYVGVYEGNVFKSIDAGTSWTKIRRPYDEADYWPSVEALTIDPHSPSRLYLATEIGLVISLDGGESWSSNFLPGCDLMAALASGTSCWSPIALPGRAITSLAIDPASSETVYAGTADGAVFRTTDGGDDWTPVTDGALAAGSGVNVIAATASGPVVLYAGGRVGIFQSSDGAQTWTRPTLGVRNIGVYEVVVDPTATATIYTTAEGVSKTSDSGAHWADSSVGISDRHINSLVIDPTSPSTLYAGSSTVFKSTDAGTHWAPVPYPLDSFYYVGAMAIAPSRPSTLYIGVDFAGVLKTIDGGASWTFVNNGVTAVGIYVSALAVDPTTPDIVYLATPPTGRPDTPAMVFKSTDGAAHWRQIPLALPTNTAITSLVIDPATPSTIYATYDGYGTVGVGVYKSSDSGETWITPRNLLPTTRVSALAIDPTMTSRVYAATEDGVFRSTDGATTWTAINSGLPNIGVSALSIDLTGSILRGATAIGLFEYRTESGSGPPGTVPVIEYLHAAFGDYFITAIPDEIARLDSGAITGWARTGFQFNAYATAGGGASPVCRFFSTTFAPKSSHFHTPFASECTAVQANPNWLLESGAAFYIAVPAGDGSCAAGLTPVYRLYNNGQGGAPNHRYTTDRTVRMQMIAQGWVPEGLGADGLGMCSPP